MKKKGFFICVEGLDGCGKTTQARLLVRKLKENYAAVYTAEPSNGKVGRFIKKYCLHNKKRLSSVVESLLFAADRFEHVENVILPAVKRGKLVISDRYLYSSLAYQGATGLNLEWIQKLNEHALHPDLAIFIDVDPEIVIGRLKRKKSVMENLKTQRKVREVYVRFVENGELVNVDGNKSKKEVADEIMTVVLGFLEKAC
ncbi:MAG: dTMP kinase [Candidatus Bathyarchaeota archaeon]|nr:dTMP kinase [Candidatus Bathyarchaeota archaeon]MDH5787598.1 dTMP kinase [Candidatus Bathyarchaeota archaeon]